jgi:acetyl-CoA C-acetyltransferase
MRSAVIVSTARTPIGRAYRGAFNDTNAQTLGGHAVRAAVERAKLDPAEVEDVIMGAALQQGCQGSNVGRQVALAAGLPDSVPGMWGAGWNPSRWCRTRRRTGSAAPTPR